MPFNARKAVTCERVGGTGGVDEGSKSAMETDGARAPVEEAVRDKYKYLRLT